MPKSAGNLRIDRCMYVLVCSPIDLRVLNNLQMLPISNNLKTHKT
jgi:hypothetical protein